MTARERIQKEAEQWFLMEPVFFAVYCSHRLTMNANMLCPLRTGQGRIEYNPTIIDSLQDNQLHELLKAEMIRILLQHPYTRQPLGCNPTVMHMASDMVIAPAYHFNWLEMVIPSVFDLPEGQHYEWYAFRMNEMLAQKNVGMPSTGKTSTSAGASSAEAGATSAAADNQQGEDASGCSHADAEDQEESGDESGDGQSPEDGERDGKGCNEGQEGREHLGTKESGEAAQDTDYTALWEEDAFQARQITEMIQGTTQWGSLPGGLIELIKESATGRIDYRNALRGFRSTILSQKRHLTRMRPSRRFGFEQMGSRYEFKTRLLVAVDTSGSVGSEELGRYLRIINTFFKYGIEEIDVLMFDNVIQSEPITLKKARKPKEFLMKGRGGTNFQAPVDFVAEHPKYDGLIIITDGDAPTPVVPAHLAAKILWVIDNEVSYKSQYEKLRKTGRVCLMQL